MNARISINKELNVSQKVSQEETSLQVFFSPFLSARKNQSRFQNIAVLLVDIQIWIYFYLITKVLFAKRYTWQNFRLWFVGLESTT